MIPIIRAVPKDSNDSFMISAIPTNFASEPTQPSQITADESLPRQAVFQPAADIGESTEIDLDELGEFVFERLKKRHRHNDIVEAVCHQTGWHWNKTQRFVARVQTKRHDELQSSKNRVLLVIGIGIILAGLFLALNGASAISEYVQMAAVARTNPEILLNVSPQAVVYALGLAVTGLGMIIGGGFGIARALSGR